MTAEEVLLSEITTPGPPSEPGLPIWHKFQACADALPDSLALVSMYQSPDLYGFRSLPPEDDPEEDKQATATPKYLRWSYATFGRAVARLVGGLRGVGVEEGVPIISLLPLGAEGALALWAAEVLDCIWIPLNTRSLGNATEITHMIRTALSVAQPGKKPLVLVQDAAAAGSLDGLALEELRGARRVVVVEGEDEDEATGHNNWTAFSQLMAEEGSSEGLPEEEDDDTILRRGGHKSSFVVFTSGTTSLPKGVHATPQTHFERYLDGLASSAQFAGQPPPRALCTGPANHVPGRYQQVWPLCLGGAVVFAAPSFDLGRTAAALAGERITHVTLVPTMVVALASILERPPLRGGAQGQGQQHLCEVRVGSAGVTPAVLRACVDELGARRVQVGYGMTEGLYIFSGLAPPESLIDEQHGEVAVGWPEPGCTVKVCNPDDPAVTLPRGEAGSVHWTGPTAAREYIGGSKAGVCYQDDSGRHWLNTGDRGRIDSQGRLFLTGRQKDMIIRGGENISPAAIETALNGDPVVAALRPQVVGAPDAIAGQVPVVVVLGRADDDKVRQKIRALVLDKMGPAYLPDEIVSLVDLGLEEYPLNPSGKIQKTELESLVTERRRRSLRALGVDNTKAGVVDVSSVVRGVWAKAVGIDESELPEDTPISNFADSITLMRVRADIKRALGVAPSMVEILGAKDITALVRLAEAKNPSAGSGGTSMSTEAGAALSAPTSREGPPQAQDMVHLALDADGSQLARTRSVVSEAISRYGLTWDEDVVDVTPAYDYISMMRLHAEFEGYKFMYGYVVKATDKDKQALRRAIETTLAHHRMLASFLVSDPALLEGKNYLHVLVRQSPRFLDLIIRDGGEIQTAGDLERLVYETQFGAHPGYMADFVLYDIASTGETAFLAAIDHSAMDGFSVDLFAEDVDQALLSTPAAAAASPRRVDYKAWADTHFALRTALPAQVSVDFHVRRLAGIAAHHAAGANYPPHSPTRDHDRPLKPPQPLFHTEQIPLSPFEALRRRHGIQPSVVAKAAVALFVAGRTGHTHALFGSFESNRSRFSQLLPAAAADYLSSAAGVEGADVAGPTFSAVIDLVPAPRDEPASSLLRRMADDGALVTRHASAPWYPLQQRALGPDADPLLLTDIMQALAYNWLGPIGARAFANLETVGAMVRPKIGLRVMAGEDRASGEVFFWMDGDAFSTLDEFKEVTQETADIVRWLVDERNWDKPVGGAMRS